MSYAAPVYPLGVMPYPLLGLGSVSSSFGQIKTKDGWSYQITPDDVLWAARAAQCEGSGGEGEKATMWTWAARFALPNFRRYGSLAALIRAHSQPVNPLWARGGSRCGPGGQYAGDTRFCSDSQLRNRELCAGRSWENINPRTRDTVTKWATARLPNPVPRAVDFASSSIRSQSGDHEVARFRSGSSGPYNVFYSEAGSRSLPADYVTVHHEGRVAGPGVSSRSVMIGIAAVGAAALFAGGAYIYARSAA